MAEKTLNTRIVQKHDIQENWDKALNFIPKTGEIIVYDADDNYSYARMKIGDGVTTVGNLPFTVGQPDWNENDPNSPNYIANRTHYEGPGYDTLIEEQTLENFAISSSGIRIAILNNYPTNLVAGNVVGINWDNQLYELTVQELYGMLFLGNLYLYSLYMGMELQPDTGEPFCVGLGTGYCQIRPEETADSFTIEFLQKVDSMVHKIPAKFLDLPELNNIGASGTADGAEIFNDYEHNTATAKYAHAEGYRTTASNENAHAEGDITTASGRDSHAEGVLTTASGMSAHAEGNSTTASGSDAHAEGAGSIASGHFSHAEGYYTQAGSEYQHVQGKCNIIDTYDTYVHIVGNGDSASARSNAHTLDWDGNAWFAGDVYVGSTSGTDKDEGSKKLITQAEVEGYVSITEADIDEICGGALVSEVAY